MQQTNFGKNFEIVWFSEYKISDINQQNGRANSGFMWKSIPTCLMESFTCLVVFPVSRAMQLSTIKIYLVLMVSTC